jgi:hypothetical protein
LPIVRKSVGVAVLTHGRNRNPVWKGDRVLGKRREKIVGYDYHCVLDVGEQSKVRDFDRE